ncbi:MAG TPA: ATP-binding protein [Gammaproteobacteria bacterium]|nr:ATP-binding protein [Gammaproteobacteria bacterium]
MKRLHYLNQLEQAYKTSRIVAILGPRQCGKTTLAREYFVKQKTSEEHYFDLEDPLDLERLSDPMLTLSELSGLVVIDEIQRIPELFPILRVLVDQKNKKRRFLILGSASRKLIQQSSESLAGRIHYIELTPFSFEETHELEKLWLRGGFPLSYLARTEQNSHQWRKDYIKTFLEQDIPNLGIKIPAQNLRRFWMMLAHYHGQLLNANELGNSLDISHNTVKKYLDILTGTFMIRQLQPWHANIAKRQVKSVKIYFRDSGIYHSLLNINTRSTLLINPKLGASWEGFALESVIHHMHVDQEECYFWATHNQAELDLLIVRGNERFGFEFKHTKTPKLTRSMEIARDNLNLSKIIVIYPGDKKFKLSSTIECLSLESFLSKEF